MLNWLLPENVADILPAEARKIEDLRRIILDRLRLYGYELVIPPLIEYLDSLLNGAGRDMDWQMFKLVDPMSGDTMALRADMTTQVARIDAHLLNRKSTTRLCYAGSVLHTYPTGLHTTREPLQIGAEIYGHAGLEADAEMHDLVVSLLELAGAKRVQLDLCHMGILHALLQQDIRAQQHTDALFDLLSNKDVPALTTLTQVFQPTTRDALIALTELSGDTSVLDQARTKLPNLPGIHKALDELATLTKHIEHRCTVSIDLSDLRGYHYHSGVMFAAYVHGIPNALVKGGRYDHVGQSFGRARPATGFSMDLRQVALIRSHTNPSSAIQAPWDYDPVLQSKINELRGQGEIVIQVLPEHEHDDHDEFICDRVLVKSMNADGKIEWSVNALSH